MTNDHDGVRELLAAWAVGALPPGDRRTVLPHLAGCESCAAEAERLRATVRLLDGAAGPGPAPGPEPRPGVARGGAPGAARDGADALRAGAVNGSADGVLALALRSRRPRAAEIAHHAAPYAAAVAGLQALVPELDGRWGTPVVHDWDAHATVAHLVAADEHLAVHLGIDTGLPASHIPEGMAAEDAWGRRTADVIAHEHGRTAGETVATWAAQAAALLATPEAGDPEPAARAVTVMGLRLPVADHFLVRAFEAWIHTDDIGRALGLPVPRPRRTPLVPGPPGRPHPRPGPPRRAPRPLRGHRPHRHQLDPRRRLRARTRRTHPGSRRLLPAGRRPVRPGGGTERDHGRRERGTERSGEGGVVGVAVREGAPREGGGAVPDTADSADRDA